MTATKSQSPGNIHMPVAACDRGNGTFPLHSLAMPDLGGVEVLPGLARAPTPGAGWARAAADALGVVGLPAAVLSAAGRLAAANRLMERLIPQVVRDRPSRLGLADRRADALLGEILQRVQAGSGEVHAIPVAAAPALPASVVHVFPAGDASNGAAACLVVITVVARPQAVSARFLQSMFDLTPAEARVACGIAAGKTVRDIAAASGLAAGTVRQQLKSVFSKTGVSRQADLVGLFASLPAGTAPGFPGATFA